MKGAFWYYPSKCERNFVLGKDIVFLIIGVSYNWDNSTHIISPDFFCSLIVWKKGDELLSSYSVQIIKSDKELLKSEAMEGAALEGIEMIIKNASAKPVLVRSDISSSEDVDWDGSDFDELIASGKVKQVSPGEDIGKIVVHWNDEKNAYTAETLVRDLPYGTYTIRESKTNNSYQRTDRNHPEYYIYRGQKRDMRRPYHHEIA